jgi:hypothetical protein
MALPGLHGVRREDCRLNCDILLTCSFTSRFKVEDNKVMQDDLAAWACIRLDRLQPGYRFISLLDENGNATPGILLVKIEKTLR